MPDKTFTIKQQMERLAADEVNEARPVPMIPPQALGGNPQGPPPRGRGRGDQPAEPSPRQPETSPPTEPGPTAATGTLSIDLQPADAEVLVDGQPVGVARGSGPLLIDVSEGRHTVQARKPGFVGYLIEVEIQRGATTTITVNLRAQ